MKYYYLGIKHIVFEVMLKGKYYLGKNDEIYGQKGLYFNLDEWSGSDIFGIKGNLHIIITKKLKNLIEKTKLKNIVFENLNDLDFGYTGKKLVKK